MSYPRQDSTADRLQKEVHAALDAERNAANDELMKFWNLTRTSLQNDIRMAYKRARDFREWGVSSFIGSGAFQWLRNRAHTQLTVFHATAAMTMRRSFATARWNSMLRHGWILDQVTPDNRRVHLTMRESVREAFVDEPSTSDWDERWFYWVDSYASSLMNNLKLNAINSGDIDSAEQEVDATKVNTPASSLEKAMQRIFDYETMKAVANGEDDVARMNPDLAETEIWRTRGVGVCDECQANEGLSVQESDGDIPLHPNCYCYWQIVPASFASLLRSGSPEDRELANEMDQKGLAPNSMLIYNADGSIAAKAIVSFNEWMANQGLAIGAR